MAPGWKTSLLSRLLATTSCFSGIATANDVQTQTWHLDSLQNIGGHAVLVSGDPQIVDSIAGPAVMFDGDEDQLLVDNNPLLDAIEFTIEVTFLPHDAFPANAEPRFFHIEDPAAPNRRVTMELRLNDKQQWYLDAFIKSELSQFTLVNPDLVHPVGRWAHAAVTYKSGQFTSFVNGQQELAAKVDYQAVGGSARTSLGARMNQVHWFNGKIATVSITPRALAPSEFTILSNILGTCDKAQAVPEIKFLESTALFREGPAQLN